MPDYRRYFVPGGTYFFTLVTAGRRPLFRNDRARTILGRVIREELTNKPFEQIAIVLLPDHLHAIWALPSGDKDYPARWKSIKARFTKDWISSGGDELPTSRGYRKQRRRGIWQARFIEHTIRDERDLHHHADYLHWNPVKHQLVDYPKNWPWSSFHRLVETGDYPSDWGCGQPVPPDFGDVNGDLLE
ncbi:MAG: transposase [Schlesneria sp.]|nr:transposase [Schlesneria sp.]